MSSIKKIKLIVWKQLKLKKYKYNYVLLEFLVIVSVFFIFKFMSQNIVPKYSNTEEVKNAVTYSTIKSASIKTYTDAFKEIYYSPNNSNVQEIMNSVFNLIKRSSSHKGFLKKDELFKNINDTNFIGIVFEIPEDDHIKNVTYTFVSTYSLQTDSLIYTKGDEEINIDSTLQSIYLYSGYAGLQMAINEILLEEYYCVNNTKFHKVAVQPFPYPQYTKRTPKLYVKFISSILDIVVFVITTTMIIIVIDEKQNGINELMKIMGLQDWIMWTGWFIYTFISGFFTISATTIMLKYNYMGPESVILGNINPIILWCLILLFYIANIAFCFTFTALFHNSATALTLSIFIPVLMNYFLSYIDDIFQSRMLHYIFFLIPMIAFNNGFYQVEYTEDHDIHIGWENVNFHGTGNNNISILDTFEILIFDAIFYFLLAYYTGMINPGKYGVPQSPYFIFQQLKKKNINRENDFILHNITNQYTHPTYNTNTNSDEEVCIETESLCKQYNNKTYLNGLNLKIYKGKILALLGHNGAGKSTFLNILTGYLEPTSGLIKYGDMNVLTEMKQFRKYLGVCPQDDRLIPYLTLEEHLCFLGMLKGMCMEDVKIEAHEYMERMSMLNHSKSTISTLSGGMKRKLCLAISLMGKSKIIVLDEPTSGLDIQSRQLVWDILMDLKMDRTIILSTHHIEEADYLSDHIAILRHGTLQCWGETELLKQKYDVGYQLNVSKELDVSFEDIDNLFIRFYDKVTMENTSVEKMEKKYFFPVHKTNLLECLFRYIEENDVGIININITCTTLEEIMLRGSIFSVDEYDECDESTVNISTKPELDFLTHKVLKTNGVSLYYQQLMALFYKKWLFFSRNYTSFILKVVLTTFTIWFIMGTQDKSVTQHAKKAIALNIQLYNNTEIMCQKSSSNNTSMDNFFYKYLLNHVQESNIIYYNEDDIINDIQTIGQYNLTHYMNIIFATKFGETDHILLYNLNGIHSLPVIIDMYTNAILLENGIAAEITTIINPISKDLDVIDSLISEKFLWIVVLIFYTIELASFFVLELNVERCNHFKHIQLMSNLSSPIIYWISNILFDSTLFILIIIVRLIGIKLLGGDCCNLLTFNKPLGIFMLVFIIYVVAALLFSYVTAHCTKSKNEPYVLNTLINSLGCIATTVYYYFFKQDATISRLYANNSWIIILECFIHLIPSLNFAFICNKMFNIWFLNLNMKNKNIENETPYLVYKSAKHPDGLTNDILFMVGDIFLYTTILACIECGYFDKILNWLELTIYNILPQSNKKISSCCDNSDVRNECLLINDILTTDSNVVEKEALIIYHLRKIYYKWFKPFLPIDDITLAVKKGDIFGLLGENSSGKSTLFKMLAGEISPSDGDSLINGYWLRKNKKICLQNIGYCSQNNYLLPELSARELVTLIVKLRGVCPTNIPVTVDTLLSIFGLTELQYRPCTTYSGGTKRKLCTAISLIGNPPILILDEPTTGVDIEGRKQFHDIIKCCSKQNNQTVILSSHNINECENLCDKLSMVFNGKLKCIGTVEHLRNKYVKGFSVLIKLYDTTDEMNLCTLKNSMVAGFQCVLVVELKTQLHYKIATTTTIKWSELFSEMEYIKNCHENIIKYYSIMPLSLEDTLLNFPISSL